MDASGSSDEIAAPSAPRKAAPYLFWGQTTSLCEVCYALAPSKIIIEGDCVFYLKRCPDHGVQKTLVSDDAAYWKRCKEFIKPGDRPVKLSTRTEYGCPYDCGLCPDHEQHSCLAIIEINDACNLTCPVCFAGSSTNRTEQRSLSEVEKMLDALVEAEGEPDLLQISGGEPTIHPDFFAILDAAKARPIRHLMVNTNGVKIARDPEFADRLATYMPRFEIYLQFDSLRRGALMELRGADLTSIRRQALDALEKRNVSTTLVVTVKKGVNDDEIADIIRYALEWSCVRGVTFQPIQDVGRNLDFDARRHRIVLSEIRKRAAASGIFGLDDFIPLPCNPDQISIAYGLHRGKTVVPVTSLIPRELLVAEAPNTVAFENYPALRKRVFDLFSLPSTAGDVSEKLESILCCLPQVAAPQEMSYGSTFRVVISQFLDRFNFDLGGVKRSCVHFVHPDGKIYPFDTYNAFYRPGAPARHIIEERRSDVRP
ncbi:MAG TPA: radical SAM protein [Parvularculaceae bacterium]|nr:radical SAM protein [Parvularculaceae bacterium]